MVTELAKTYYPADVEPEIAGRWEDARAFHAEPDHPGKPYCIVMPPPNVTAALHMGHALNNTLQDILIRHQRMLGSNTLWMPGTDHAGIATQTVVEKRLLAEEGKKRTEFTREQFVAKIQAHKDEYETQITNQLKAMGCSCDWDRQRFTMDDMCAKAVREAFFRLFKDGLIYRGKRLVNWDPATQTALADDEVEMRDIDGHFYYLKYPLEDGAGYVTVATTRPETMLGDTAVAINPKDPQADALRGKKVKLPIVNRVIPIIEDDYVVLPDPDGDEKAKFSSGFLKVTPAHDHNDWEIGQRFNLDVINVFALDATISDQHDWPAEDFARGDAGFLLGLDRYEARKAIVDWFRENDLLEEIKPYRHAVGHSYRSHVAIEPYLSDQWYVKVTDNRLAGAALAAMVNDQRSFASETSTQSGGTGVPPVIPPQTPGDTSRLHFHPARYAKTFQTWHENLRDWCISRQLWWGHQIPVWSKESGQVTPGVKWSSGPGGQVATHEANGILYVCLREDESSIIGELEAAGFERDPDVLDTWFSSAMWPIGTMGWPEDTAALKTWNPGNLLCTAREIITLWVSRMVMFNLYLCGCLPFTDVFIHAMIQDGDGRKMSKSLGNGVDPLDIINSHGADAMRFTLAAMTTNTQDVRMPVQHDAQTGRNTSEKFDIGRNFANKLWNAARFVMGNLEGGTVREGGRAKPQAAGGLADRWILSCLAGTVSDTHRALRTYDFSQYAQGLYDFFWRDFCDWYIEAVKSTVKSSPDQQCVLATCLDVALRLLHPVMPFITEKLWEELNAVYPQRGVEGVTIPSEALLIRAPWPRCEQALEDEAAEADFCLLQQGVGAIREIRQSHQIPLRQPLVYQVQLGNGAEKQFGRVQPYIETFANAKRSESFADLTLVGSAQVQAHTLRIYHGADQTTDRSAERNRLTRRLDDVQKGIRTLQGRLHSKGYIDKAPAHLVEQTHRELSDQQRQAEAMTEQLDALQ